MRSILILLTFAASMAFHCGATGYDTLQKKATLFYDNEEWASALAMYTLMIDERPSITDNYSHAIISSALCGQADREMQLLEQSTKALIPLDSLYDNVQRLAFEHGEALLYEQFLKRAATTFTWLRRNIESRLLDYYTWRRDGQGMVQYAQVMLDGMPDDIKFLTSLADGYFILGDNVKAIGNYHKIISIDKNNYHALLVLGNYYLDLSKQDRFDIQSRDLATQYLSQANDIRPTPYVTNLLK